MATKKINIEHTVKFDGDLCDEECWGYSERDDDDMDCSAIYCLIFDIFLGANQDHEDFPLMHRCAACIEKAGLE